MKWFGESWGAPVCELKAHTETPVGEPCEWCEETFTEGDEGLTVPCIGLDGPSVIHYHYPCWMRTITGSVGHQNGNCHCFGGKDVGDPPGRTRREAAEDAWDKFVGRVSRPKPNPDCGPRRRVAP